MELTELLSAEHIYDDFAATDKSSLLRKLAHQAAHEVNLNEADVIDALLAREKLGSTGIGQGIAIPHARVPNLKRVHCAFYKLKKPIEFGAMDDLPVDVVILLLVPQSDERGGIQALSCVARKLKSPGVLDKLRSQKRLSPLEDIILGK